MPVSNGLPNLNERVALNGYLAAGPAAGGTTKAQAFASAERASRVIQAFIFPSADVALNAGAPSTFTVQVGATVIATGSNAAAAVTAAAGLELTITAANADLAAGDVVKVVADNGGAGGAENLGSTGFAVELITRVA